MFTLKNINIMIKTLSVMLLILTGFYSCAKSVENSSHNLYYVVGYDGTSEVDVQKGTAKSAGYLLISEANKDLLLENNLMDNIGSGKLDGIILCVNLIADIYGNRIRDPFDGVIDFPAEIMPNTIGSGSHCAWRFFPEEYRFAFKVQMSYRPMTEEEERYVPRRVNAMCYNPLNRLNFFNCIVITSISKIQ